MRSALSLVQVGTTSCAAGSIKRWNNVWLLISMVQKNINYTWTTINDIFNISLNVTLTYWSLAFIEVGLYYNGEISFEKGKSLDWIWTRLP